MIDRRAKRAQYKAFASQLRALHDRDMKLRKEEYLYVELEKPQFVGYEKYFVLREDCQTPMREKLLALINTILFSKRKHFNKRVRRKSKRAHAEKGAKTIPIEHKTQRLYEYYWSKLSVLEQAYFTPIEVREKSGFVHMMYEWSYPWMLVSKVRKKFITQIRVPNPDKMSESDRLSNYIEAHQLRAKMQKMFFHTKINNREHRLQTRHQLQEKQALKEIRQEPPFISWLLAGMICFFSCNDPTSLVSNGDVALPFLGKTVYSVSKKETKMDTLHQKIPFHTLTDQNGQIFRSNILDGQVYMAHFFFTTCPSVCPKTQPLLQKIATHFQATPNFKIIAYSIDPQYDTPERLKLFATKNGFDNPNHVFLTGNKDTIYQLANEHYNTTTFKGVGKKDIAHTGALILIDNEKRIRGMYNGMDEHEYNRCVTDITHLLTKL